MSSAAGSPLREVRGPGALGGGWRRFFELLLLMSATEFKRAYFGTVLGYLWSLLRPLLLFGVLLVVFTKIFRIGSDQLDHYPVFLLVNIVLFSFFQEATMNATGSVVANEGIVRKTQFPRLVIPMSIVLTSLFNLGMNLVAVLIFTLAFGVFPQWTWLFFPAILIVLVVATSAVSTLLAALYVRRRDLAIIWGVLSTALFYGSTVLYPITIVPEGTLRDVMFINPLVPLFVQTNKWLINPGDQSAAAAAGGWEYLIPSVLVFAAACGLAVWTFNREAPRVAEEL
ncbi:MAG: ABC transporter permease [Solirubrobacterales bacterium]|nr:ABC transporter permease [Solirubrobacterales bacterium]